MIINFIQEDECQHWRVINDSVMGGISKGHISSQHQHGIFTGYISKENNGGFSSIVRPITRIKQPFNAFVIDVENKQQSTQVHQQIYQLRAIMHVDGYRLAYKHDVTLQPMKREQIHLPLHAFEASFRGRIISNAPNLTSEEIIEIGILVKSQLAGEFSLCIHSISVL